MSGIRIVADFAAIAGGGAVGAMLRHLLTLTAAAVPGGCGQIGTAVANVAGCLALGAVAEWAILDAAAWSPRTLLATRVGMLGGLTTFSTFAAETLLLAGEGRGQYLALYLLSNLGLGIFAVWVGAMAVRGWLQ